MNSRLKNYKEKEYQKSTVHIIVTGTEKEIRALNSNGVKIKDFRNHKTTIYPTIEIQDEIYYKLSFTITANIENIIDLNQEKLKDFYKRQLKIEFLSISFSVIEDKPKEHLIKIDARVRNLEQLVKALQITENKNMMMSFETNRNSSKVEFKCFTYKNTGTTEPNEEIRKMVETPITHKLLITYDKRNMASQSYNKKKADDTNEITDPRQQDQQIIHHNKKNKNDSGDINEKEKSKKLTEKKKTLLYNINYEYIETKLLGNEDLQVMDTITKNKNEADLEIQIETLTKIKNNYNRMSESYIDKLKEDIKEALREVNHKFPNQNKFDLNDIVKEIRDRSQRKQMEKLNNFLEDIHREIEEGEYKLQKETSELSLDSLKLDYKKEEKDDAVNEEKIITGKYNLRERKGSQESKD